MRNKFFTVLGLGLSLTLSTAFANTISLAPGSSTGAPGSGTVPNNGSTFPGTLVASLTNVTEVPGVGSNVDATMSEYVYRTSGGTLDFFYQVTNVQANGGDNLRLVTAGGYTGWTTAVAYDTNSGTVAPSDAFRSGPGDTVNFDFLTSAGVSTLGTEGPDQGSTSDWLEIDTNATSFALTGYLSVQDSGNASALAYAPTVPEPMSLGLLGGGLALLGIARWRRAARQN